MNNLPMDLSRMSFFYKLGRRIIHSMVAITMVLSSLPAKTIEAKELHSTGSPGIGTTQVVPQRKPVLYAPVLQASLTPVYYLLPVDGAVSVAHPAGKYWASGGTSLPTPGQGDIIGLAFDVVVTGNCPIFKRMSVSATGGTGFGLWGNTSDDLEDNTYLAIVHQWPASGLFAWQIRDALVPGAIITNVFNRPSNNVNAWAGYQLGWSNGLNACSGSASASNFRWVVYGTPPVISDKSVLSSCQPKNGPADPRECSLFAGRDSQGYAGDPVNTRTGGVDYGWVDLSVPTAAGPLTFQRTYATLASGIYTTTLGSGWTHNQDIRLIFPQDPGGEAGSVWFKAHTANQYRFTDNSGGTFGAYPGVLASLTRSASQPYTYTLKDAAQNTYLFDASHRLQSWTNPQGIGFTYSYTGGGQLQRVSDPSGQRYLDFTYTGSQLVSVTDHTGREVQFAYTNGNLTEVTDVLDQTWTYQYSNGTYPHHLTQVIDPRGITQVRTEYDASGRAWRQYDGLDNLVAELTYHANGTTAIQNGRGYSETHAYDGRNTLVSRTNPLNETLSKGYAIHFRSNQITNPGGKSVDLTWSEDGATLKAIEAPESYSAQMSYDGRNNLTEILDPLGNPATFEYNDPQDPTKVTGITDADANSTAYDYAYDQNDLLASLVITDSLGITSTLQYSGYGEIVSMADPSGTTHYEYDDLGRLERSTDPLGQATFSEYDEAGRLIRTTRNYDPARPQNDANEYNLVTEYEYDEVGNLVSVTDTLGRVTFYEYDHAGRLIRATRNYDPNRPAGDENQYNLISEYGYDAVGNRTSVEAANGIVTRFEYDELDRLSAVVENYRPGLAPDQETNVRTEYAYDSLGNLSEIQDANGNSTSLEYDDLNRLSREVDPLQHAWEYGYDPAGNLTSILDANGDTTLYEYDVLNRLVEINYADDPQADVTFAYNGNGWRTGMSDDSGATTWAYDDLGRPTSITADAFGSVVYAYDAAGNRTYLRYPDDKEVAYDYDSLYRLSGVTDWSSGSTAYAYDAASRLTSAQLPNGAEAAYAYNQADGLIGLTYQVLTNTLSTYEYGYDLAGNRVLAVEGLQQPDTSFVTQAITYTYDSLYRLIAADSDTGAYFHYEYDPAGNRSSEITSSGTITYTYDTANRLTAVNGANLSWDDNGNLLADGANTYTYDYANRLISVAGASSSSYEYNGLGDRLQQTVDGVPTDYSLDLNNNLTQALGDGSATYLYGLGRIGEYQVSGWQYPLGDALGSVRQLADGSGAVTLARSYAPFGELLSSAGSGAGPYGFSGEASDPSGLIYLRARYYDPQTGRFINRDSFAGSITRPASLHRFTYAENNPVNLTDPSGHYIDTLIDLAFIGYDIHTLIKHLNSGCGDIQSDLLALGLDVGGALLPFATGLGMVARIGGKTDDVVKIAGKLDEIEEVVLLLPPPNRTNFPWHHIFPQRADLAARFAQQGIDIHKHLIELPVEIHRRIHSSGPRGGLWNKAWQTFFEAKPRATAIEIYKHAGWLIHEFGLDRVGRLIP